MTFDLNIEHYEVEELRDLFKIQSKSFTSEALESQYQIVVDKVEKNIRMDATTKQNTLAFLDGAKSRLMNLNLVSADAVLTSQPLLSSKSSKSVNLFVDKLVPIDSRFRSSPLTSNSNVFTYAMSETQRNITGMSLLSFEWPSVVGGFMAAYGNTHMTVDFGGERQVLIFPDVWFSNSEEALSDRQYLLATWNNYLASHSNDMVKRCSWVWAVQAPYGENNMSVNFVMDIANCGTTTPPSYVELDFTRNTTDGESNQDLRSKLGWMVGYRSETLKQPNTGNQTQIELAAPSILDVYGSKYAYLIVDDFQSSKLETIILNESTLQGCAIDFALGGNAFAKMVLKNKKMYKPCTVSNTRHYTGPVDISKFRIALIDEFGRLLQIQNADWACTFRLHSD